MPALPLARIAELLAPFYAEADAALLEKLSSYLDLLLRWNERTNLTAIRAPEEIVRRHFGESLFLARHIAQGTQTLLDLGTGAGFPGVPVQLARPDLRVTLAESQNKKVAFLHEVLRTLPADAEIWSSRVESMAQNRTFDAVTLRAVDHSGLALKLALERLSPSGQVLLLGSSATPFAASSSPWKQVAIPQSDSRTLFLSEPRSSTGG